MELAEEIFHMPVRLGSPQKTHGLNDIIRNPIYATAVGLLLYGADQEEVPPSRLEIRLPGAGWLDGMRQWLGKHF